MKQANLAGCIILNKNTILLLHRIKKDWYELPGGKIDEGESPQEAAIRELKEELTCDIEILYKVGEKSFEENGETIGYIWFLANIKDGQIPTIGEPEKFDEYIYIPLTDLSTITLSPNMKNFHQALRDRTITLSKD